MSQSSSCSILGPTPAGRVLSTFFRQATPSFSVIVYCFLASERSYPSETQLEGRAPHPSMTTYATSTATLRLSRELDASYL